MSLRHLLFIPFTLLLFTNCRKEQEDLKGCTDKEALNYDPGALRSEEGACEYPEDPDPEIIWDQGKKGAYDGQEFLGVFNTSPCGGALDTMTLNPNDTIDPGPFSMLVEKDTNDRFGFVTTLTNNRDLSAYRDAKLEFKILDPDSTRNAFTFQTFVHGKVCNSNPGTCPGLTVCRSSYVNVATDALNDSAMRTVTVPIPDHDKATLNDVDHVMGIRGEVASGSDTVFAISKIRITP